MLVCLKLFISFFICISSVRGREKLEINLGQKVQILSDKAFRRLKEDKYEAIGNVIMTYGHQDVYGEEASLSFRDSVVRVTGSVRYIDPTVTLYASELIYNFKTGELSAENARALSDRYVILGKKIVKKSNGEIIGEDAEYTTCKDCPESWSIFGKNIKVTLNEYISIKHAYIKAKGTVVLYFPYLILPIKKERESGLLFPYISISQSKGVLLQIPYFWAINAHSDMTLTPSLLGKRGRGGELQYRHIFDEKKWFEIDTLYASDPLYANSHREYFDKNRYIGNYEHHFSTSEMWNHHFVLEKLKDLDVVRDFDFYTKDKVKAPDVGGSAFLGFRRDLFQFSLEGHNRRNQIFHNSVGFDKDYVQILPRLALSTSPISLHQRDSSFLRSVLMGLDSDYTVFRQKSRKKSSYIRNVSRLNSRPYVKVQWGNWQSLRFSTLASFDHQYYKFNRLERQRFFRKSAILYETGLIFSFGKAYGKAHVKKISVKNLELDNKKEDKTLIEAVPTFETKFSKDETFENISSYKYSQDIILKHHLLSNQKLRGNRDFHKQISFNNGIGQFDYIDAIRSREHLIQQRENLIKLPKSHTAELQWGHSLIRKRARYPANFSATSENQFDYKKVAYLGLSQGYDLNLKDKEIKEKLTRLHLTTEFHQDNYSFTGNEYFFHSQRKHIFQLNYNYRYDWGRLSTRYDYDSLAILGRRFLTLGANVKVLGRYTFHFNRGFDFQDKDNVRKSYGLLYSPANNCWKINLKYHRNPFERTIFIQFLINFNKNQFHSFGRSYTQNIDAG